MKKIILHSKQKLKSTLIVSFFLLAPVFFNAGKSFAQSWVWAKTQGGTTSDKGEKVCKDAFGNTIVVGTFLSNNMTVGPFTISNAGLSDIYIAKYDVNGVALWAKSIGGVNNESVGGICVNPNGDIFITGFFRSPNFTAFPHSINKATTAIDADIFITSLDASGTVLWLNGYGAAGEDVGVDCVYSITQSALYVTGYYSSTSFYCSPHTLYNSGGSDYDVFVLKFNIVSNYPGCVWVYSAGVSNGQEVVSCIGIDPTNSYIYISGSIWAYGGTTASFGNIPLNFAWGTNWGTAYFVAKISDTGVTQWINLEGGVNATAISKDLTVDAANNFYVTGYYDGPLTIGSSTITNSGQHDGFLAKYNSNGLLLWLNKVSAGPKDEVVNGITTDGANNIYLSGSYAGTVVTIGAMNFTNTAPGSSTDIFVAKYNASGSFQWATTAMGAGSESANGIISDPVGNLNVTGFYDVNFPTVFGSITLNGSSSNSDDSFLAKIGCLTATISGLSTLCQGTSATLTASGATNYTWSTGATTSSIIITPTANASYSVLGAIGSCTGASTNFSVTFLPASVNTGPNLNLLCNETQLINATTNPSSPTSVTWTPTTGLNNSSILTPSVIATTSSIQYTLFANLSNGCMANDVVTISQYAPTPNICMVTVDSIGVNNLILWDKSAYPDADTFYVYRDIANNNYQLIGKVLSTATFGEFQDTVRSLYSANGDPKASSWRYKIAYIDSCGNASAKSPFHKTLFVQNNNGNFTWNDYQVEGQPIPVPTLNNYIFRRDNNATGNWQNIQTLSSISTAYTDPNYNSFASTADWRAETQWSVQCNSNYFKNSLAATVKRSKSNLSNNRLIGLKEKSLEKFISIYPNPSNDVINLDVRFHEEYEVCIENALGQIVYASKGNNGSKVIIVNKFTKGFYTLKIKTINSSVTKKIIVE